MRRWEVWAMAHGHEGECWPEMLGVAEAETFEDACAIVAPGSSMLCASSEEAERATLEREARFQSEFRERCERISRELTAAIKAR